MFRPNILLSLILSFSLAISAIPTRDPTPSETKTALELGKAYLHHRDNRDKAFKHALSVATSKKRSHRFLARAFNRLGQYHDAKRRVVERYVQQDEEGMKRAVQEAGFHKMKMRHHIAAMNREKYLENMGRIENVDDKKKMDNAKKDVKQDSVETNVSEQSTLTRQPSLADWL